MLRGLGSACSSAPPWCWEQSYFSPVHPFIGVRLECVSGLYLYEGHCEAKCPPNTYPEIDPKERAVCLPCHYTCLTCAGEAEGQCTSCHDEAVPIPSGMTESKAYKQSAEVKSMVSTPEEPQLSWGKRGVDALVRVSPLRKKAVTKKILEPYEAPRSLFYCYPARVVEEMKSNVWYHRMSVLFALNLVLLIAVIVYFLWNRFSLRRKSQTMDQTMFRYSKMNNGDSLKLTNDSILYVSSSSEEE